MGSESDLVKGTRVLFTPHQGEERTGIVIGNRPVRGVVGVLLDGDPFGTCIKIGQLRKEQTDGEASMPPDVAQLRKEAIRLGIESWEELTIAELEAAVFEARGGEPMAKSKSKPKSRAKAKTTSRAKKAPARKPTAKASSSKRPRASAKARTRAKAALNGSNPYREGSSMAYAFDLLLQGGTVGELGNKLIKKFPINLRATSEIADEKAYTAYHGRGRVLMVLKQAKARGSKVVQDGRGPTAFVQIKG